MVAVERAIEVLKDDWPVQPQETIETPVVIKNPLFFRALENSFCPCCEKLIATGEEAFRMPSTKELYHPECFLERVNQQLERHKELPESQFIEYNPARKMVEVETTQKNRLIVRLFGEHNRPPKTAEDQVEDKRQCPLYYFVEQARNGEDSTSRVEQAEYVVYQGHLEERKNGLGKKAPVVSGEILRFSDLPFEVFISASPLSREQVAFLEKEGFVYVFGPGPEFHLMKSTFSERDFGKNGLK